MSSGIGPKALIIDSNYICHTAKHTMRGLSFDELQTGVIFGFFREIHRCAKKFGTRNFVFAWDSRKNFRKEIFPEYKKKREDHRMTEEEQIISDVAFPQFTKLRQNILPQFGFENIFIQTGYESDDLIASIVRNSSKSLDLTVVSSDADLYQLLDQCSMFNLRKKAMYGLGDFTKEYGISPKEWSMVKALAGCSTDGVPGIGGVGEITAIKHITDQLKKTPKNKDKFTSTDSQEIINRNLKLVRLPFKGTKEISLSEDNFKQETFYRDDFMDICQTYGFRSFLTELKSWETLFEMR